MISYIKGNVALVGGEFAVIEVSGIGLRLEMPLTDLSALPPAGTAVKLFTCLIVREDGPRLYGFLNEKTNAMFNYLLQVSGVGPKMALAVLSRVTPEKLVEAVASGKTALLTEAPGVGKKTAERIIWELKNKIVPKEMILPDPQAGEGDSAREAGDALTALESLGYGQAEARIMVASALRDLKDTRAGTTEIIRRALSKSADKLA